MATNVSAMPVAMTMALVKQTVIEKDLLLVVKTRT